jgi:GNAT superfamily N-acetyltransferase
MPDVDVRPALLADAAAATALLVAQLREHDIDTPETDVARTVGALLERPHRGRLLLALRDDVPIGVAALSFVTSLEHGGRAAWLEELYVVPAEREHGVGGRLLAAACDAAAAAGGGAVDLEVETAHARAARLYARAGFAPLTRTRWVRRLTPARPAAPAFPTVAAGGCFCGRIRYRASGAPLEVSHCHCPTCRRVAAAPLVTWATWPAAACTFTTGTPRTLASSPDVERTFCGDCGTPLTYRRASAPATVDVTVASLDHPEAFPPADHVWTSLALPWLTIEDDLPRLPADHAHAR